jgi:hypothetical protein
MLNHPVKTLFVFISCLTLLACHKAPILDNTLALKLISASRTHAGYPISVVTNNPNAHGDDARGWNCADKQSLIDSAVVTCKKVGRSGVYLKFTREGKKLLLGNPWGDAILRNARVIAVSQRIQDILSIEMIDASHALVNYTWVYNQYTPFSSSSLKELIALNVPQTEQISIILKRKKWLIEK